MSDTRKACEGADTIPHWHCQGEMHECVHCGCEVQWDLVEHPFFGFAAGCPERRAVAVKGSSEQSGRDRRER